MPKAQPRSVRNLRERPTRAFVFARSGRMYYVTAPRLVPARLRGRPWLAAGALVVGLAACGGGEVASNGSAAAETAADASPAEAAAAENLPLLQPADQVVDFEVLQVADGSISSLREEVTGDRPVLLWFFSPH